MIEQIGGHLQASLTMARLDSGVVQRHPKVGVLLLQLAVPLDLMRRKPGLGGLTGQPLVVVAMPAP